VISSILDHFQNDNDFHNGANFQDGDNFQNDNDFQSGFWWLLVTQQTLHSCGL